MDWEVLEKDSERLDEYFRCLYYIEVCREPGEDSKETKVQKIQRRLSSPAHYHAGVGMKKDKEKEKEKGKSSKKEKTNEKKEREKGDKSSTMSSLKLQHAKSFASVAQAPKTTDRGAHHHHNTTDPSSKSFMAVRKELRQTNSLLAAAREEVEGLKKEKEMLGLDLKQERQRADQLKKLLEANGVAVPEHLQLSKVTKAPPKTTKQLKRTSSNANFPPKESKPPVEFWSSGDKKIVKCPTADSTEATERLASQMVPQMDIVRPNRGLIQEGSCVIVDCEMNEVPAYSDETEPELYKLYLLSDAILLAQVIKKKKIRPEIWLPLADTRLESNSEEFRRRWLVCLVCEIQAVRVAVFLPDRNLCKNWGNAIKNQIKLNRKKVFFGVPLEALPTTHTKSNETVPTFVSQLVEYLRETASKSEGIFRLAGTRTTAEEIRDILEEGGTLTFSSYDPHTLGDILKQWFRELPDPVIPFSSFRKFMDEFGKGEDSFLEQMENLLNEIPLENLGLLRYICQFLNEISQFSDENMMTPDNLSTCFGPNLLRPEGEFKSAYEPLACNQAVCLLIENFDKIPCPKSLALPPSLLTSSTDSQSSPKHVESSPTPAKKKK